MFSHHGNCRWGDDVNELCNPQFSTGNSHHVSIWQRSMPGLQSGIGPNITWGQNHDEMKIGRLISGSRRDNYGWVSWSWRNDKSSSTPRGWISISCVEHAVMKPINVSPSGVHCAMIGLGGRPVLSFPRGTMQYKRMRERRNRTNGVFFGFKSAYLFICL